LIQAKPTAKKHIGLNYAQWCKQAHR